MATFSSVLQVCRCHVRRWRPRDHCIGTCKHRPNNAKPGTMHRRGIVECEHSSTLLSLLRSMQPRVVMRKGSHARFHHAAVIHDRSKQLDRPPAKADLVAIADSAKRRNDSKGDRRRGRFVCDSDSKSEARRGDSPSTYFVNTSREVAVGRRVVLCGLSFLQAQVQETTIITARQFVYDSFQAPGLAIERLLRLARISTNTLPLLCSAYQTRTTSRALHHATTMLSSTLQRAQHHHMNHQPISPMSRLHLRDLHRARYLGALSMPTTHFHAGEELR